MSSVLETVQLPPELRTEAANLAEIDGVSLEEWVVEAVAHKVKTAKFFHERREGGSGKSLAEILQSVPDNPPIPGDELPAG